MRGAPIIGDGCVSIPLNKGQSTLIDLRDLDRVSAYTWSVSKGSTKIYAARRPTKGRRKLKTIFLHRFIINAPDGLMVDHINGDSLDNRRANLRVCTRSQNLQNAGKRKGSASSYKGVGWSKAARKWCATVKIEKKSHHLGLFVKEEEAARAYDTAAKQFFGPFARLNFPEQSASPPEAFFKPQEISECANTIGMDDKRLST